MPSAPRIKGWGMRGSRCTGGQALPLGRSLRAEMYSYYLNTVKMIHRATELHTPQLLCSNISRADAAETSEQGVLTGTTHGLRSADAV